MSMMLYLLAAAANNRNNSSNSSRISGKKKIKQNLSYYGFSNSPTDYILKEMAYGESLELKEFFTKLYSYGELLINEHNDELRSVIKKNSKQIDEKITPEALELKNQEVILKNLGVKLDEKYIFYCAEYYHDSKVNDLFDGKIYYFNQFNNLLFSDFVTLSDDINDDIRRSDIRISKRKDILNKSAQKRESMVEKKNSLIKELENLKSMINFPIGKDKRLSRIECIKKEISKIDEYLKSEYLESKRIFDYELLTYEQKASIIRYIKIIEKIQSLCFEYQKNNKQEHFLTDVHIEIDYSFEKNEELWLRALYRMFREENMDLEYIDNVFEQIWQTLVKGVNDEYDMRTRGGRDFDVEKYGQVVNFFMDNIYAYEIQNILTQRISYSDICGNQLSKRR